MVQKISRSLNFDAVLEVPADTRVLPTEMLNYACFDGHATHLRTTSESALTSVEIELAISIVLWDELSAILSAPGATALEETKALSLDRPKRPSLEFLN